MRNAEGQVDESYSISAGLDYPGVGPQHAHLHASGRATYVGITDAEALEAFQLLAQKEGIIPALESSHALAYALKRKDEDISIVVSLSGRGDKDIDHVRHVLGDLADETGAWQRYADDNAAQKNRRRK